MWKEFFGEWGKAFQKRRWWWIIPILLYKLLENWLLDTIQSLIQSNSGPLLKMLANLLNNYPWLFTLVPIAITIIILLVLTWSDSRKILKASINLKSKLEQPLKTKLGVNP